MHQSAGKVVQCIKRAEAGDKIEAIGCGNRRFFIDQKRIACFGFDALQPEGLGHRAGPIADQQRVFWFMAQER